MRWNAHSASDWQDLGRRNGFRVEDQTWWSRGVCCLSLNFGCSHGLLGHQPLCAGYRHWFALQEQANHDMRTELVIRAVNFRQKTIVAAPTRTTNTVNITLNDLCQQMNTFKKWHNQHFWFWCQSRNNNLFRKVQNSENPLFSVIL